MDTGIRATRSDAHCTRARGRRYKAILSGTISDLEGREHPAMKQYTVVFKTIPTQSDCLYSHACGKVRDVVESAESEVVVAAS